MTDPKDDSLTIIQKNDSTYYDLVAKTKHSILDTSVGVEALRRELYMHNTDDHPFGYRLSVPNYAAYGSRIMSANFIEIEHAGKPNSSMSIYTTGGIEIWAAKMIMTSLTNELPFVFSEQLKYPKNNLMAYMDTFVHLATYFAYTPQPKLSVGYPKYNNSGIHIVQWLDTETIVEDARLSVSRFFP